MWIGDVVLDRFVIERPVGSGGMGSVFLATDKVSGDSGAVKVMDIVHVDAVERFRREARVLSDLSHPGIVRYVSHGETLSGEPFLVMEWLDGETLGRRLARGPLPVEETVALVRRVAEALAFAHEKGFVHRDVKPSNLFLVGGDSASVKVLDFGIARRVSSAEALTHSGALLGTLGYMAPEQALATGDVDARADVFSLGCVLFECLTGRAPFSGEHALAVLAKVLHEDPPRISELLPGLGIPLDALVAKLLAKNRALRPPDAGAVLRALDGIEALPRNLTPSSTGPKSITHAERRVVSVIFAEPAEDADPSEAPTPHRAAQEVDRARAIAARFGAEVTMLTGTSLLLLLSGKGTASDQAMLAASCALALRELRPAPRVALATGRAETTGRLPVGRAIDRAAALLRAPRPADDGASIAVDDVTAGLLGSRFDVRRAGDHHFLHGEQRELGVPRLLMGKPTPFVGREKELSILDAVLAECLREPISRAVLVTGPPGIGKSRLRAEFLHSVTRTRPVTVILARGDRTQAGSSFALARQLVRHAAGLGDDDRPEVQRASIRDRLGRHFTDDELSRVSEFIAELVGVGSTEDVSPLLRAARDDARIMSGWMLRSFEDWLDAECSRGPVLVAIEDLHWGDAASIKYLTSAFHKRIERALMALAFARPDVHEAFPQLAASLPIQEILLGGLTRRPAEQLVATVLGNSVSPSTVSRVVKQADGNAFFLEELIRAVAEGRAQEIPDTAVALAEARLDNIVPEARRVLRAASVFGEVFTDQGVCALLGPSHSTNDVIGWFQTLADLELIVRLADEHTFAFRHDLLREAAYGTLTESDRENGHRLAAEWLAQAGEKDALVIAEHFDRGAQPVLALPWRLRAAETALNAGNNDLALVIAARGLGAAQGELRGRFLEIQQFALAFRGEWAEALGVAEKAMSLLPAGSTPWFRSAGSRIVSAIYLGRPAEVLDVIRVGANLPAPSPSGPFGLSVQMLVSALLHAGAREFAVPFAERLEASAADGIELDPVFTGWRHTAHATMALFMHDRIAPALEEGKLAMRSFDSAADSLGWSMAALYTGIAHVEAGSFDLAKTILTEVAGRTERFLLPSADFAKYYLARVEALAGRTAAAEALLDAPPGIADGARGFLAEANLQKAELESAALRARAIEHSASCYARVTGLSVLGRVELARGRPREALEIIDKAILEQDRGSGVPFWRSTLLLARAEARMAAHDPEGARTAVDEARRRISRIARDFADEPLRECYLALPVHRRTLALAEEWR